MEKYVLLTGSTGLLGRYLLRDLLLGGHRVAVVIRPNKKLSAEQRLEQVMQHWETQLGRTLPRPICISGDINDPQVTDEASRAWIADNCAAVMHSAASLQFKSDNVEPWRTNVDGTKNVVQLCADTNVGVMHYISTAYVCGDREGPIMESDLAAENGFKTDYEESKCHAEKLVREHPWESLTVYRPVVITGDSETGYTSTYHGTYLYMKLTAVVCQHIEPDEHGHRHIPIRWGITGKERRNITPVNWNSEVICHLYSNPQAHDRTFHLAPEEPITMQEAMQLAYDFYGVTGVQFLGFGKDLSQLDSPVTELERRLWANIAIYGEYDFADPEFDTTNLKRFAGDISCPKFDNEVGERILRYAEEDRWGKRPVPAPQGPCVNVNERLDELTTSDTPAGEAKLVGLDLFGPGGGQWTLLLQDWQIVDHRRGIPRGDEALTTVEIDVSDFEHLSSDGSLGLIEHIKKHVSPALS